MWICREHENFADRAAPASTVLVPTMGALHEGHLALVRQGTAHADDHGLIGGCVVTIFVNPTQFDEPADYERYARTLDADIDRCRDAGAAGVYAPAVGAVYPQGRPVPVPELPGQAIDKGLEDTHRPGHFAGVCQVVRRLFDLVRPAAAVFGEKDWQQLRVIEVMTRRDRLPIRIIRGATVREPDGLAMSSRNRFLSTGERPRALALGLALAAAGAEPDPDHAERAMRRVLAEHAIDRPDYATVRDADTLGPPAKGRPARALIAARVGSVRLLDNAPWPLSSSLLIPG
jgi:pantoate--beta-alanine ligase